MLVYVLNPVRTKAFRYPWVEAIESDAAREVEFLRWCGQPPGFSPFGRLPCPLRVFHADPVVVPPNAVSVYGRPFVLAASLRRFRRLSRLTHDRAYLCPAAPLIPRPA